MLALLSALAIDGTTPAHAQTLIENETVIASTGSGLPPAFSRFGYIPPFDLSTQYNRLVGLTDLVLEDSASISQSVTNTGSGNIYPSVNGSTSFTATSNGVTLATFYLFPTGSGVVGPHSTGTVYGSASGTPQITFLSQAALYGVTVTSNLGTGPNLRTSFGLLAQYSYMQIGLTESDPVAPILSGGAYAFKLAPTNRWYDPAGSSLLFTATSAGGAFTSITLPTGEGTSFLITTPGGQFVANGQPGDTVQLPSLSSFVVNSDLGVNPAYQLGFNSSNIDFTIASLQVPEPSTLWGFAAGAVAVGWVALRRQPAARRLTDLAAN